MQELSDRTKFEILLRSDRALTIRELSEGHEYNFVLSFDDLGSPLMAISQCREAVGSHGMAYFVDDAQRFATDAARQLGMILSAMR